MSDTKSRQAKKGRLLALREFFYKHTDENHPVTTQQLIEEMKKRGYSGNRKTIRDDIDMLNSFGIDIIIQVSRNNSFFMGFREFELSELKLLVDAVSSARFISASKSDKLINKLTELTSEFERNQLIPRIYTNDRVKTSNSQIFYVIDKLIDAVRQRKKVRFRYIEFDANKRKILRNNGEVYVNSPYGCLWSEEFYYLVGHSEKHSKVVTFRVDRIVDLEIMEESVTPEPEGFKMSDYARVIIEMFDGKRQVVELECDNHLMKYVIDRFGEEVQTEPISGDTFKATVTVSASKTFYSWCFRFAGQMRILSPESVKREYCEMARKVMEGAG